ncbi:MAG TPA: hypothetical protein VGI87_15685 [Solirubrobacteraceae bacterium]
MLIQIGAAATLRDAIVKQTQTYTSVDRATRQLKRFERRGERIWRRGEQTVRRRRREVEHTTNGWRADAESAVKRVA